MNRGSGGRRNDRMGPSQNRNFNQSHNHYSSQQSPSFGYNGERSRFRHYNHSSYDPRNGRRQNRRPHNYDTNRYENERQSVNYNQYKSDNPTYYNNQCSLPLSQRSFMDRNSNEMDQKCGEDDDVISVISTATMDLSSFHQSESLDNRANEIVIDGNWVECDTFTENEIALIRKYGYWHSGRKFPYCNISYRRKMMTVQLVDSIYACYTTESIDDWLKWFNGFVRFAVTNRVNRETQILQRDLLPSHIICGVDLRRDKIGEKIIRKAIKYNRLEMLRYLYHTLKVTQLKNTHLFDAAYWLHYDMLAALLSPEFGLSSEDTKYISELSTETIEESAIAGFRQLMDKFLIPLEQCHRAPILIEELNYSDNEVEMEMKEGMEGNDSFAIQLKYVPQRIIDEAKVELLELSREDILRNAHYIERSVMRCQLDTESEDFMIESCYYGLVLDMSLGIPPLLVCYTPHKRPNQRMVFCPSHRSNTKIFGYILFHLFNVCLTVIPQTNALTVRYKLDSNDANVSNQLFCFDLVDIESQSLQWHRIISLSGYAIIADWNEIGNAYPKNTFRVTQSFPDTKCRDCFRLIHPNNSQWLKVKRSDSIFSMAQNYRFYRIANDGSRKYPRKVDTYLKTLDEIIHLYRQHMSEIPGVNSQLSNLNLQM